MSSESDIDDSDSSEDSGSEESDVGKKTAQKEKPSKIDSKEKPKSNLDLLLDLDDGRKLFCQIKIRINFIINFRF